MTLKGSIIYEFSRQDLAPSHGAFFIYKSGRLPRTKSGCSMSYHL